MNCYKYVDVIILIVVDEITVWTPLKETLVKEQLFLYVSYMI